jgi:hypothetical protein
MSLVLAGAMAASLAIPAFAADGEDEETTAENTIKVTGTYQAVDIDVTVPTEGTLYINPYALPVAIGKDADDKDVKVSAQIVTKPLTIKNQSDVNLDINLTASATVAGNLALATAPVAAPATETKNSAFIYVAIESASTLKGEEDAVTDAAIATAYAAQQWTEYNTTTVPSNVLALSAKGASKTGMGVLTAAKTDDSGDFSEYDEGSIAFVGITGNCAQAPKTAWATTDGLTATLAFTFTPHVDAAEEEVEPEA